MLAVLNNDAVVVVELLFFCKTMIDVFGKFHSIGYVKKLFDETKERSVLSWTSLIARSAEIVDIEGVVREVVLTESLKLSASFRPGLLRL